MSTIGIIHSGSNNKHHDNQITALRDVLLRAGVPKKDILDPRWADDDPKTLHDHADDSIDPKKDNVDVLVAAGGSLSASEAKRAITGKNKIVVFTSVAYPPPPAANITGICARTSDLDADRLDLLHQLTGGTKFGALAN